MNFFSKLFFCGVIAVALVSCDKDFNEMGSNLIDDAHYDFESYKDASLLAFNMPTGTVQTSNLPINSLGYYDNGMFGKTKASFVTQLELASVDPDFYGRYNTDGTQNANFKVDSVYLHIPYFSTLTAVNEDGSSTYELDSIQGSDKKIRLSVYESGYFLRNYDPESGLQEVQRYYSNQRPDVEAVTNLSTSARLNNATDVSQNDQFEFKSSQIKFLKTDTSGNILSPEQVRERLVPGIYMDLDKNFFKQKIFYAPDGSLTDNNVFKNYFRGLYFKVDEIDAQGAMARLNFARGKIVIVYHGMDSETSTAGYKRKTLTLNLAGNTVNFLENTNYNPTAGNSVTGDTRLYPRGGNGNMAVIKLFGDNPAELQALKNNNWLINEANLVFYVDNTTLGTTYEQPNRIYLYDLKNKRALYDYYNDLTSNSTNPKKSKFVHDGIITKNADGSTQYKIRITNHIRNILSKDSTNVPLGLVVTESINDISNAKLKNSFTILGQEVKYVPSMSVANPLGTILWGNTSSVPETKKLRLEIFYTKPD